MHGFEQSIGLKLSGLSAIYLEKASKKTSKPKIKLQAKKQKGKKAEPQVKKEAAKPDEKAKTADKKSASTNKKKK